eukprot:1690868-Pleurochrysis_carterae.AAC.4
MCSKLPNLSLLSYVTLEPSVPTEMDSVTSSLKIVRWDAPVGRGSFLSLNPASSHRARLAPSCARSLALRRQHIASSFKAVHRDARAGEVEKHIAQRQRHDHQAGGQQLQPHRQHENALQAQARTRKTRAAAVHGIAQ